MAVVVEVVLNDLWQDLKMLQSLPPLFMLIIVFRSLQFSPSALAVGLTLLNFKMLPPTYLLSRSP